VELGGEEHVTGVIADATLRNGTAEVRRRNVRPKVRRRITL
jgi:hypothetical protein